jgi:hypothetical protein
MQQRAQLFSILTLVMLGLTAITVLCYVLIAINPYLPINPFPPSTRQIALVATNTPTPTPSREAIATWTPTTTPTATPTRAATFTPTPTGTATPITPSPTASPTPTPTPRVTRSPFPFTYEIEYETPRYGCSWMGVGGTVQDLDGNPLIGYPIHVWGGGIDAVVTSGDKQIYGDSGWEQFFMGQPTQAQGVFRVQIHARDNPDRPPISEVIELNYEGYCSQSLALITFVKNH